MRSQALALGLLAGSTMASPLSHALGKRQTCPSIHIFGARETTASPGYGSAGQLVDAIISANPGATSEAIDYPASGDNPWYAESRETGVSAVNSQVAAFASQCPDTQLVVVGYSQVRPHNVGSLGMTTDCVSRVVKSSTSPSARDHPSLRTTSRPPYSSAPRRSTRVPLTMSERAPPEA